MAGRNEGCGSIGCAGICFLALLVAMCTGGGSGESADEGYVPHDPPSYSAPAPVAVPSAPSIVVEDTRPSAPARELHVGPRGGCYYVTGSGNKTYVDRSECAGIGVSDASQPLVSSPATSPRAEPRRSGGRQLHVGPRGGCYYINGNGNKTYVDRSQCH